MALRDVQLRVDFYVVTKICLPLHNAIQKLTIVITMDAKSITFILINSLIRSNTSCMHMLMATDVVSSESFKHFSYRLNIGS